MWMRLGSWMAAAPGILTSKTPFSKLALILSSSTSLGSCRLLRKEPERRSLTRYPLRSSSLSSSSLPEMVRTPLWTAISTSSGLAPGSSALTTRSSSSWITSIAGDHPAFCVLCSPCSPGDATEHLVEQAVHLAQRVVEPAAPVSAHHGLYPLLSRLPRISRRDASIPSLPSSPVDTKPPSVQDLCRLRRTLFGTPGRVHLGRATQSEGEYKQQHAEGERVGSDQPHQ